MEEIWKATHVVGYEVSNLGRVRSVDRTVLLGGKRQGEIRKLKGRILRLGRHPSGHLTVLLGAGRTYSVHILVAEAFIGPCPIGCEVLHWDGIPHNCCLDNLRYGTRADNLKDMVFQGKRNLTVEQIRQIRIELQFGKTQREVAQQFNVRREVVGAIIAGRHYSHVR